jgi:hypothetical protein
MIDYSYMYKSCLSLNDLSEFKWDVFLSAFNKSERVRLISGKVNATNKVEVVHHEYRIFPEEFPAGAFFSDASDEDEFILQMVESRLCKVDLSSAKVCVDITGFLRPHLMFLLRLLVVRGVRAITAIYAEPAKYSKLDDTLFGTSEVHSVRQVKGFEGSSARLSRNDLLIIASGFEERLVAEVAEDKDQARKILVLGLPSLKADMYQQSVIRSRKARDALGDGVTEVFAPAADPFATASLLSGLVEKERQGRGVDSLYLSPIATKPSALGFCLYFMRECGGSAASIVYPFSRVYSTESSDGIGRIWMYDLEFE